MEWRRGSEEWLNWRASPKWEKEDSEMERSQDAEDVDCVEEGRAVKAA